MRNDVTPFGEALELVSDRGLCARLASRGRLMATHLVQHCFESVRSEQRGKPQILELRLN